MVVTVPLSSGSSNVARGGAADGLVAPDVHPVARLEVRAPGRASQPLDTLRRMTDQERQAGPVGRVVGTEDSTPLHFWVALSPERYLQLDDVVICERPLPDDESVTLSGIVTQVVGRQEGAQFASDVFLIADGVLPGEAVEVAEITVSRVEPEIYVPPLPGAEARRAEHAEREHALFFDDMEHRVPIGLDATKRHSAPTSQILDSRRRARGNISPSPPHP